MSSFTQSALLMKVSLQNRNLRKRVMASHAVIGFNVGDWCHSGIMWRMLELLCDGLYVSKALRGSAVLFKTSDSAMLLKCNNSSETRSSWGVGKKVVYRLIYDPFFTLHTHYLFGMCITISQTDMNAYN